MTARGDMTHLKHEVVDGLYEAKEEEVGLKESEFGGRGAATTTLGGTGEGQPHEVAKEASTVLAPLRG